MLDELDELDDVSLSSPQAVNAVAVEDAIMSANKSASKFFFFI
jgi:hypothetical protein